MNYTPKELREFINQLTRLTEYLDLILLTEMEHFLLTDRDLEISDKTQEVYSSSTRGMYSTEFPYSWFHPGEPED